MLLLLYIESCREQQYQLTLKYVLYGRSCIAIWQHALKLKAIYTYAYILFYVYV